MKTWKTQFSICYFILFLLLFSLQFVIFSYYFQNEKISQNVRVIGVKSILCTPLPLGKFLGIEFFGNEEIWSYLNLKLWGSPIWKDGLASLGWTGISNFIQGYEIFLLNKLYPTHLQVFTNHVAWELRQFKDIIEVMSQKLFQLYFP